MNLSIKAAVLLTVVLITTLAVPATGQPERGIEVGQRIEPRELRTMEREKIMVPVEEGLTVLLFWSTWSPRSEGALKLWQRFGGEYGEHGVQVVTVNADHQDMRPEDVQKVRDYYAEKEIALPVIVDSQLELFNEIGVIVLPTTLIFKPDGTLDYKYAGFPTSAELDLKEDLEAKLGIVSEPTVEEKAARGRLAYQPRNNALLFYNMGKQIQAKGFPEKAKAKYIEALQRDSEYEDPLRALEGLFFEKGRTPDTEDRLKSLLTASGLEAVIVNISDKGEGPEKEGETGEQGAYPDKAAQTEQTSAPAATPEPKRLTPMERMRLLMEKSQ